MDKTAALTEILHADPTNAFARYGLAMEHISQGQTDTALAEFATLIHHNPDYVPPTRCPPRPLPVSIGPQKPSPD